MKRCKLFIVPVLLIFVTVYGCILDKTPIDADNQKEECWTHKTYVRDYDFLKNRYFFVDTYYKDYYEQGYTDNLCNFVFLEDKQIQDINVFISTYISNADRIDGVAALNPSKYIGLHRSSYDTIAIRPGKIEKDHFVRLIKDRDYYFDSVRGFIGIKMQLNDNQRLAVSYKTNETQVGTMLEEFTNDPTQLLSLRLIKSKKMLPEYQDVWPLSMRNVYFLGDTVIQHECFNVSIEYNLNGEHQTIQQIEPKKSYIYLLGLDRTDKNCAITENGDGVIDNNSLLVNRRDGILIFPGLQPFDPVSSSRFQIADTTRAQLYDKTSMTDLIQNTCFDLIVTMKKED